MLNVEKGIIYPIGVEDNQFIFLLKEDKRELIGDFDITFNMFNFSIYYYGDNMPVVLCSFLINNKYLYTTIFPLCDKHYFDLWTSFVESESFKIIISINDRIYKAGPYKKNISIKLEKTPDIENFKEIIEKFFNEYKERKLVKLLLELAENKRDKVLL